MQRNGAPHARILRRGNEEDYAAFFVSQRGPLTVTVRSSYFHDGQSKVNDGQALPGRDEHTLYATKGSNGDCNSNDFQPAGPDEASQRSDGPGEGVAGVRQMSEVPVQMPKLSMAASDATFIEWLVSDGERVEEAQPLYTVATDKVETEVDAPASGILRHGDVTPEEVYEIGYQVGTIEVFESRCEGMDRP
jgi:biotin carboxyl carrier protein